MVLSRYVRAQQCQRWVHDELRLSTATIRKAPRQSSRVCSTEWREFVSAVHGDDPVTVRKIEMTRGSAKAQRGEALPHRHRVKLIKEAPPPPVEAQPRRMKLKWPLTVSRRLTALCGGGAAPAVRRNARNLTTGATPQRTANLSLLTLFLITL